MQETNEQTYEETPLIQRHAVRTPTPLPVRQLCGLLPILVVDPMIGSSITPYINHDKVSSVFVVAARKRYDVVT